MTTATRARPGKRDVAVQLAACVLAIQKRIGGQLAMQQPRIGHIATQARAAFAANRADWVRLATPVITDALSLCPVGSMPSGVDLAPRYVAELGGQLNEDAACALDAAMDLQLAKGQHPDVAWQRAVAGYGLADAPMRGYIATASAIRPDGATALLATSKTMAFKALLVQADRIGNREATAWSTLPRTPVAKAYDPHELRDETGRWATRSGAPGGKPVKAAEGRVPDVVDRLLAGVGAEPELGDDRYVDRYAVDRYTAVDRYAGAGDARYAAANTDRYAAAGDARYAGAAPDRYATPAPETAGQQIFLFGIGLPNEQKAEPYVDADRSGLYLPWEAVRKYFYDTNRRLDVLPGRATGAELDFTTIDNFLQNDRGYPEPIELSDKTSPWEVAEGAQGIDQDDWSRVLVKARRLWDDVQVEPMRAAIRLKDEVHTLAKWAGYHKMSTEDILKEIETNYKMRENGIEVMRKPDGTDRHYDPGLLDALADYVVWVNPSSWGAEGINLANDLQYELKGALNNVPIPKVISFGNELAPDEDGGRMHGRYAVDKVRYLSAIGTFGTSAPVGKIALREIKVKPERV